MRFKQQIDFHTTTSDLSDVLEGMFGHPEGSVNLEASAGLDHEYLLMETVDASVPVPPTDAQIVSDFAANPALAHPDLLKVMLRYLVCSRSVVPQGCWIIRVE